MWTCQEGGLVCRGPAEGPPRGRAARGVARLGPPRGVQGIAAVGVAVAVAVVILYNFSFLFALMLLFFLLFYLQLLAC